MELSQRESEFCADFRDGLETRTDATGFDPGICAGRDPQMVSDGCGLYVFATPNLPQYRPVIRFNHMILPSFPYSISGFHGQLATPSVSLICICLFFVKTSVFILRSSNIFST
jgi:hypothetical protein